MAKAKVVIIGGGFGGVRAALNLAKLSNISIELISDKPDFRFFPALYRYVVGRSHQGSMIPLTDLFVNHSNVKVSITPALKVDAEKRIVTTKKGQLKYDYLIVALGSVTNYFGIAGLEKFSYGMKTVDEAKELRRHLHQELLDDNKPDLNYVVVGGGPTGVELAAALVEYLQRIIKLHGLNAQNYRVDLVEAANRILPRMPRDVSRQVTKRLRKLAVHLYLKTSVQGETVSTIKFKDKDLKSETVIWTAGMANHPFFKANPVFPLDERGKVQVDSQLSIGHDIYVIGDNAATPYSGMAQTALYDADFVADNLDRQLSGERPHKYRPKRPVYVVPVGNNWAAVLWGKLRIYGWLGWALRKSADWVAYNDVEPFGKAWESWIADEIYEEGCLVCSSDRS
jgi:NADH dehydrogenase